MLHAAARRGVLGAQGEVALGLASLGVECSEEVVEPVTGYRVDMLLHGSDGTATGRCAVEVGIDIFIVFLAHHHYYGHCHHHRRYNHNI